MDQILFQKSAEGSLIISIEVDRLNQDDIVEVEGTFYASGTLASNDQSLSSEQSVSDKNTAYMDINMQSYDQAPIQKNNEILFPLRNVFNEMGATVKWEGMNQSITVTQGDLIVKFIIGSKSVLVNEQPLHVGTPIQIINGYAMIPGSVVAEVLGAEVQWEEASNTIKITTKVN